MTSVGTYTRKLIIARFAATGDWCRTAQLIFPNAVPEDIATVAQRERDRHVAITRMHDASACNCAGCLYPEERA